MAQSNTIATGLGRYVGGDHANKRTKDHKNRDIQPDKQQYEIGIAFDKNDPDLPRWLQPVFAHAYQEFARVPYAAGKIQEVGTHFPANAAAYQTHYGKSLLDGWSWKIWDGDTPNAEGKVSEHTRGKWVFYFKSSFPIKISNSQNAEIPATALKRGDFVDVAFTVAGNGLTDDTGGLYWNPQFVRLVYEGDAIAAGGASAAEVFGSAPAAYAMPAGARAPGAHAPPPAMAMPGGAPMPSAAFPQSGPAPSFAPAAPSPVGAPAFTPAPVQPAPAAPQAPSAPSPTGFPGSVPAHPTFAAGPQQ